MVRKRDPFWEHAVMLNNRFQCNFCKKVFSGGITRLKFHLARMKGNDIEICEQVSDDVQAATFLTMENSGAAKRLRSDAHSTTSKGDSSASMSSLKDKGMVQTTMPDMIKKMDKNDVDNCLARYFVLNNISFNVVQSPSFHELVKAIAEFGPRYKLPSFSTLRVKLIPRTMKQVDEYVSSVKASWEKTGCTIMSDTWTDMKQRCFINFIAQSPGGAVFLQSVEISKYKKTGTFLMDLVSNVIEKVGPHNVVQFVTDNASNFESAGDMLIGKYPTIFKNRCAAHGIQLLLKDIYSSVEWVKKVVDNSKSIQAYLYRHQIVTALMREATNGKELKRACATRFASNFLVVQSLIGAEDGLRVFVASAEWRGLQFSKTSEGMHVTELVSDPNFWEQARDVIELLEPLVRILRLVDGDGSTSGYIFQAMEMAKQSIEYKCSLNNEKYSHIKTLLSRRRDANIIHPVHAAAAFLNPAFRFSSSFVETREMRLGIDYVVDKMVESEEKATFLREVQLYRTSYAPLMTSSAKILLTTSHPRVWWDYCGDVLPVLQKYVVRILSQPCSSSSCERNWSAFEAAQTKKRNRLTPKMLAALVYVRMNSMMIQNFQKKAEEDMNIINLENLKDWPDFGEEVEPITEEGAINSVDLEVEDEVDTSAALENSTGLFGLEQVCLTLVDDDSDDDEVDLEQV